MWQQTWNISCARITLPHISKPIMKSVRLKFCRVFAHCRPMTMKNLPKQLTPGSIYSAKLPANWIKKAERCGKKVDKRKGWKMTVGKQWKVTRRNKSHSCIGNEENIYRVCEDGHVESLKSFKEFVYENIYLCHLLKESTNLPLCTNGTLWLIFFRF